MFRSVALTAVAAWLGFICNLSVAAPTPSTLPADETTLETVTAAKQLGEACRDDAQCRQLDQHAVCRDGFCACDSGFYQLHEHNGTLCDPAGGTARAGGTKMNFNMIVAIVAIAVMFIGICVALHLFSRARFWNRRTVFNSPHPRLMHIKLGKKNKKKKLTGSQHLTTPQHYPQVPRHHSFSGQHVPSPIPLNRVPKTRSHECLRSAVRRDSSPKLEMRCPPRAPLAEKESSSVPSTEDLDKKTPELLQNGVASALIGEQTLEVPPCSPTVIVTDADGSHQVVSASARSSPGASSNKAVDV